MISSRFVLLSAAASVFALPQGSSGAWQVGQAVKTTSGTVRGHAATWPKDPQLSEYLGVPFAKNPTGDLRFEPPQAFKGDGQIDANIWSPDCHQVIEGARKPILESNIPEDLKGFAKALIGWENQTFSEDCLKLNIWTKPQSGEKSKAVLVWIYGGAWSVGASSAPYYSPARFAAEQDVVAVNINYRLNILGFPMATFLENRNLGYLDQRLAIEWVRDNIAGFGGDPKRITIFGESAGGTSVDQYSYAWTKDPIVNGFIAQSGTVTGLSASPPTDKQWDIVAEAAGCSKGKASIECMKKAPIAKLMEGVNKLGPAGGATSILAFWPVADGKVVFADAWDREKKGKFIKRPMLVGNMEHEGYLLVGAANAAIDYLSKQDGQLASTGKQIKTTVDYLSNSLSADATLLRFYFKYIEDGIFKCPAATAAEGRATNGVPVWRYIFNGDFKNLQIGGAGTYHVSDVPLVMGTTERRTGVDKNEPEQEKLIKNVMTAWATFAKDPENGLSKLGWPKYSTSEPTITQLGLKNSGDPKPGPASEYDKNCKSMRHVAPSYYGKQAVVATGKAGGKTSSDMGKSAGKTSTPGKATGKGKAQGKGSKAGKTVGIVTQKMV